MSEDIEVYGHTRWSAPAPGNPAEFTSGLMFFNLTDASNAQLSKLRDRLASTDSR